MGVKNTSLVSLGLFFLKTAPTLVGAVFVFCHSLQSRFDKKNAKELSLAFVRPNITCESSSRCNVADPESSRDIGRPGILIYRLVRRSPERNCPPPATTTVAL